jgi:hypothetical protein
LPERLEKQYRFMERHPDIGICSSWAQVIDETGRVTGKIVNQISPEFVRIHLLFSVPVIQPACCVRTALLKQNPYRKEPVAEDYELWCRLNEHTKMANLPEFLLQYRWHETNISKEKEQIMAQFKEEIITGELQKLKLYPNDAEMRIHTLSFLLHGFNRMHGKNIVQLADLQATEQWFERLLTANRQVKRYDPDAFNAYLWSRWLVLCLFLKQKRKIFFPPFISCSPKVLFLLLKQILLLVRK